MVEIDENSMDTSIILQIPSILTVFPPFELVSPHSRAVFPPFHAEIVNTTIMVGVDPKIYYHWISFSLHFMLVLSFYASTSMRYYHFMLVLKWGENKKNGVENGGKINAMVGKKISLHL